MSISKKFKLLTWKKKLQWVVITIAVLTLLGLVFGGDAEATVEAKGEQPAGQPFALELHNYDEDRGYILNCVPFQNSATAYVCKLTPK